MSTMSLLEKLKDPLTDNLSSWKDSSLLSVTQITPSGLHRLIETSKDMMTLVRTKGGDNRLQHKVLATVFYEASTRTSCSFQAAMLRLGGTIIHVDGQGNSSANKKGESLSDTIQCLQCYTDVTVLRHPIQGSVGQVIEKCSKPVLNAGDGTGEHPTQALLDVFTICDELNYDLTSTTNEPLTVVLLGDLKHGRTVHSLAKLLSRSGMAVKLRYCSPDSLAMPDYVKDYVEGCNIQQEVVNDLNEAIKDADVLYVTRVQKERFESEEAYDAVKVRCCTPTLGI
jgi:aspartate carbamoyltransferase